MVAGMVDMAAGRAAGMVGRAAGGRCMEEVMEVVDSHILHL